MLIMFSQLKSFFLKQLFLLNNIIIFIMVNAYDNSIQIYKFHKSRIRVLIEREFKGKQ